MKRKIYRAIVRATQWLNTFDRDLVLLTFAEIAISITLLSVLIVAGTI